MSGINRADIKQLRILDALLEERNLSRVAIKMGLTQQAISEQLRKLRGLFDDRLFIRQGNGMVPTPQAEELGQRVKLILNDIEGLLNPQAFDPATYKGMLQISATDCSIQEIVPKFMAVIRESAPGLKVVIRDFETDNLNQLMVAGEIDIALTFPSFITPTLHSVKLFEENYVCVAASNSPLLNRTVTIAEIAKCPQLIISPSRPNLRGSLDEWFSEKGLARNVVMSVPSFAAAPDVIGATNLIAFYPSGLLPNDKIKQVNLNVELPKYEVIAAWHNRTHASPIHKWLIAELKKLYN
ncbi:LysR family transcriptional regulator [Methylophaga sp.]|uniref:LysR family transcriptional regulator n=1 Tax=Methylophaga sp. TaxID=2024840 RepID=UPI003F71A0BB